MIVAKLGSAANNIALLGVVADGISPHGVADAHGAPNDIAPLGGLRPTHIGAMMACNSGNRVEVP